MGAKTKYKPAYAKELLNGLRRYPDTSTGGEYLWTKERLCWRWKITRVTLDAWINEFTSFREAFEISQIDFIVCCQEQLENDCRLGKSANAALRKFQMSNFETGMSDKKEVTQTVTENRIQKIEIEVIQPRAQIEEQKELIDITPEQNNVIKIISP